MKTQTAIKTLYSLWLPIVNFQDFKKNIDKKYILENHKNSNWSWVIVRYSDSTITIDSLGYVYIEMDELEQEIKDNPYILQFIANSLDNETKIIINETLLNKKIGYVDENLRMDIFLQSILIKINPIFTL